MTSATLSGRKKAGNTVLNIFFWSIKKHKALLIVYSALLLFSSPIIGLLTSISVRNFNNPVTPATFGILTTGVAMIMTLIVPVIMLDYLHNKRKADMFCSLPITRRMLFFSRYLAGLAILIVPYIINAVIACALSLPCGFSQYPGFSAVPFTINTSVIAILAIVASYSFTSFISLCCGTTMNAVLCTIFINIAYPFAYSTVAMLFSSIIPGVNIHIAGNQFFIDLLSPLFSPIGDILASVYSGMNTFYHPFINLRFEPLLSSAVIIAASLALSFVMTKKRKSETAQTSFAYKTPGIIIRLISTAAAGLFIAMISSTLPFLGNTFLDTELSDKSPASDPWLIYFIFILTFAITAFVAHLVVTVIFNKGFKGFLKSLISYAIVVVMIVGIYTSLSFGGFGADKYIPEIGEVESAEISYSDMNLYGNNLFSLGSLFSAGSLFDNTIQPTPYSIQANDEEDIKSIIDIHRDIIDNISDTRPTPYHIYPWAGGVYSGEYYSTGDTNINSYMIPNSARFIYRLKNGSTVVREYDSSVVNGFLLAEQIFSRKEHIDKDINTLKSIISDNNYEITGITLDTDYGSRSDEIMDKAAVNAFISAFIRDFDKGGSFKYSDRFCDELQFTYRDKRTGDDMYLNTFIPKSFKNTITMLSRYGYTDTLNGYREYNKQDNEPTEESFTLPDEISEVLLKDKTEISDYKIRITLDVIENYFADSYEDMVNEFYSDEYEKILVDAYKRNELYCRIVYTDSDGGLYCYDEKFSDFERYKNQVKDFTGQDNATDYYNARNDLCSISIPILTDKSNPDKIYSPSIIQFYTDDDKILTSPINLNAFRYADYDISTATAVVEVQFHYYTVTDGIRKDEMTYIYIG